MAITLLTKTLTKNERANNVADMDKKERMKQVQDAYYQRRGFFLAYKRRIASKLNYTFRDLKHLSSVSELDSFCSDELTKRGHVISDCVNPSVYILKMF
jgi:hypothetical protein